MSPRPSSRVLVPAVLLAALALPAVAQAQPLQLSVSADQASVAPRGHDGYTIQVSNPNAAGATLTRLELHLPDHGHAPVSVLGLQPFAYRPGTTTGFTAADPAVRGHGLALTWRGSWTVPAGQSISLHAGVIVSGMVATYLARASGSADVGVARVRQVAPITVEQVGAVRAQVSADVARVCTGGRVGYTITITNAAAAAVTFPALRNGLAHGFSYVAGSASGLTTAEPTTTTDGHILRWHGPFSIPGSGSVTLRFATTAGAFTGTQLDRVRLEATGGGTLTSTGPTAPVRVTAC